MQRPSRILATGCAVLLAAASVGPVTAGNPPKDGPGLITVSDANGFVAVDERTTAEGAAVGTYRSETATVTVIGRPGSSVSFQASSAAPGRPGTLQVSMSAKRPKTARDATSYRDAGRSVVGDLVALGMPRDDAVREFGDLVTAAGSPYDTQCASINVASGKITGYGCSTFLLVHRSGSDWWLMTKMKVSVHSNDESWFSPKRLTQLGWRITWGAGNVLHDWDPYTTQPVGSCVTLTVKSSSPWADVSAQGNICPDSLGPWAVTTARSGGIWNGMEHGTDYEGALATQAVHSPPGAAAAYQSAWTLSYCDLWCN